MGAVPAPPHQAEDRPTTAPQSRRLAPSRRLKNEFPEKLRAQHAERVWALDEMRAGLKVWHRRRWCPRGVRPPWVVEDRYEWVWLYAAVEPVTGESFTLLLPHLDGVCFEVFLQGLRQRFPSPRMTLVLDGTGSHTSQHVRWPAGLTPLPLVPYSPELNPAERWFEELRKPLANEVFDSLEALEKALTMALIPYWQEPATLQRLIGYPWWLAAVHSIRT